MAYNQQLAQKVKTYFLHVKGVNVQEKQMFGGLAFLVNEKMCVNVSGDRLMCRFNTADHEMLAQKIGFEEMRMKGKELQGYAYINKNGWQNEDNFIFWMETCLDFNDNAKKSK